MVQAAIGFKCRHGNIYNTHKEAVECDMGQLVNEELERRAKLPGGDKRHAGEGPNGVNLFWVMEKLPKGGHEVPPVPPGLLGAGRVE